MLYEELVEWYGEGTDREVRAASKLLMIALLKLREHDGDGWHELIKEYIHILKNNPERYQKILDANKGNEKQGNS